MQSHSQPPTTKRMCIHSKRKELVTKMQADSPACLTTTHYLREASYRHVAIVKVQLQRVISCATGIEMVVGNPYLLSNLLLLHGLLLVRRGL